MNRPEGGAATVVADVPVGTGKALAVWLGDWVGWLSLAGLAFFAVGGGWLVKRNLPKNQ